MSKADLHLHTPASDGKQSVEERIEDAGKQNFEAIAITDHDIITEELSSRTYAAENRVEVITGVEFTCEVDGTGIEILGYFLDPEDSELDQMLEKAREYRSERMLELTENVGQAIDQDLEWEDVSGYIGEVPVRPHLAEAMVDKGVVNGINQAFSEFLTEGCETYVSAEKLPAEEVIDTIHRNGGAASLAHPGRDLTEENAEEKLGELVGYGLDGIEVPYTYQHKLQDGYDIDFQQLKAKELQEDFDLLITGGSDCHGKGSGKYNMGKVELDTEYVEELRHRAESYQS